MPFTSKKSFTLIELLVVIAIISLFSSIVLVGTKTARERSRDSKRKQDIVQLEKALLSYWDRFGQFPGERYCDSSIGSNDIGCPVSPPQSDWSLTSGIWQGIVGNGIMGSLSKDPINNATYYYYYEPCCEQDCGGGRTCVAHGCCEYDIGATRLETTGSSYSRWGRW